MSFNILIRNKTGANSGHPGEDGFLSESFQIENIVAYLNDIGNQIKHITGNSEQQFLEIGSKLQIFLTRSRAITLASSDAASSITGAILKNGITEINWLLKQFSQSLSSSSEVIKKDKSELMNILSNVSLILDGLEGFRKIVKHLRMLGISTKIESARLGDDDKGFNTLADHVEKLSHMINEKAAIISFKSSSLLLEINKTTKELDRLEKDQKNQSNLILNSTDTTLAQLEGKYNESSIRVENISKNSVNVSKNIGTIVTAIQFHDITRQQMEHVFEALDEMAGKAENDVISRPDEFKTSETFALVHDVCELQTKQFNNSINEFVDAVENIINHLKGVEDNVSEIFSETLNLLSQDDSSKGNTLNSVKEELSVILSGLNKNEEISIELSKSIKDVIEIVEDLAKYVLEIEEIGTEIEIIALNARIKAAHTGLNGLALGVLAEEIQKLSIDAKAETISITKILQNIGDVSKVLKLSIESSALDSENQRTSSTNEKIISLINSIIELEKETKSTIGKIRSDVNSLKEDINTTTGEIKIHHQHKAIAEQIIDRLHFITSGLKNRLDISSNRSQNVSKLLAKYTMDSERKIHNQFSEKEIQNESAEAFGLTDGSEDDFGDNVDLF